MQRNVQPDGRMVYQYWPSRGEESTANNMVRQFMASIALGRIARDRGDPESRALAERNLRYNLEHFYHEEDDLGIIEYDGTVKLGAIALAGLAIAESTARSEFAAEEASLLRTVDALRREDGTFQTFYRPEDRKDGVNFYPGEALSLWAHLYHESPDPALLARIRASQKRYARWHRRKRNPAFIPYHTMAAYRIWLDTRDPELRDWIFELNDWVVQKQEKSRHLYDDIEGRLYGPPHASATGVYLEGLADAFALALETGDIERIESYRKAIRLGLRSALQLEFRDDVDMFYVSKRDAVRGGLRTTVYDNEIRVDNVQHVLMAVHKVLATFREEDFAQGS